MWCRATIVIVLLLATLVPAAAQTPSPPPADPPAIPSVAAGDSSIRGRVIDKESKRPLAGALVLLMSGSARGQLMTQTDENGAYTFENIAAGDYRIAVRNEGYVEEVYGATVTITEPGSAVPVSVPAALRLERGETRTADFALARGAILSGRVTRDDGRPLHGAIVSLRMPIGESGYRFSSQWSARTNERGEYSISGVAPGQYHVGATWNDSETAASTRNLRARSIFHPGTDNIAEARVISVVAGRTLTGIDIKFPVNELLRIQGRVVAGTATGPMEAYLVAGLSTQGIPIGRDGTFSTPRLPMGRYTFVVRARDEHTSEATVLSVDLTAEMSDVVLGLMPTGSITGRLVTDEGTPPPDTMQVAAVLADGGTEIDHLRRDRVDIGRDGTFELRGLFGERVLQVVGFTDGWTVEQVLVGKTPIKSVVVHSGSTIDDVRIVLTRRR